MAAYNCDCRTKLALFRERAAAEGAQVVRTVAMDDSLQLLHGLLPAVVTSAQAAITLHPPRDEEGASAEWQSRRRLR